jgi:hypothetical protein
VSEQDLPRLLAHAGRAQPAAERVLQIVHANVAESFRC